VIAELDERKRQLVKDVEAQQVVQRASDEFFEFMEKRFMPDLSIRLSADSVEKYRDEITDLIGKARRKRKEFKATAERELRRTAPELVTELSQSVYWMILDGIEARMHNASSIMLPALRHALNGFTRRADLIIRQLSYSSSGVQNQLNLLSERIKSATPVEADAALKETGRALSSLNLALIDPDSVRLRAERQARTVNTTVEAHVAADKASRKQLFIQGAVDLAFNFNSQGQREYVVEALSDGHRIHSQNLPVTNAKELLMSAHIIEIGSVGASEFSFKVDFERSGGSTDYFESTDEFTIQLMEN